MDNVFAFRDQLIDEYGAFSRSFTRIAAADIGRDLDRRARLRTELDAYYARLYGLTRDELRYILDPADVMGEDYP